MQVTMRLQNISYTHAIVANWIATLLCWAGKQQSARITMFTRATLCTRHEADSLFIGAVQQLIALQHLSKLYDEQNIRTSLLPVFISSSVMGRRHCSGMLNRSKSDGRTPSHLMSGVVRLLLSYDMFIEPACPPNKICVHHTYKQIAYQLAGHLLQVLKLGELAKVVQ